MATVRTLEAKTDRTDLPIFAPQSSGCRYSIYKRMKAVTSLRLKIPPIATSVGRPDPNGRAPLYVLLKRMLPSTDKESVASECCERSSALNISHLFKLCMHSFCIRMRVLLFEKLQTWTIRRVSSHSGNNRYLIHLRVMSERHTTVTMDSHRWKRWCPKPLLYYSWKLTLSIF